MEETLHKRVIGQDKAVKAISCALCRAQVGLKNPDRPIARFIFPGPTGVGKTELAKSLASCYFGSEDYMIRFDMSEYMERHSRQAHWFTRMLATPRILEGGRVEVKEIADKMLSEVCKRLKYRDIKLQVTKRFKDKVAKEGYEPKYGARPLRRAFMRLLEDRLAERILMGEIRHEDSVILDANLDWSVTTFVN
ncbi:hypothetical protein RJ639_028894 [Escallonia herrerae]|uniref:Clp ATPase C-terminal domain-containing protein n=1 Tax=Escallonia herrerae TaxID=1293975 RepID=A0AA89BFM4_9ASTE|nr:hypothetical protein RJ639_028894 [Escallonia herrerae]